MFEPADSLIRDPLFTTQLDDFDGLSKVQPLKLLRLNIKIGWPHLTWAGGLRIGARCPVHVQASPFGPCADPLKVSPTNLPSKTRSFLLPSSSFGETN